VSANRLSPRPEMSADFPVMSGIAGIERHNDPPRARNSSSCRSNTARRLLVHVFTASRTARVRAERSARATICGSNRLRTFSLRRFDEGDDDVRVEADHSSTNCVDLA
jgi:hypothetical protein